MGEDEAVLNAGEKKKRKQSELRLKTLFLKLLNKIQRLKASGGTYLRTYGIRGEQPFNAIHSPALIQAYSSTQLFQLITNNGLTLLLINSQSRQFCLSIHRGSLFIGTSFGVVGCYGFCSFSIVQILLGWFHIVQISLIMVYKKDKHHYLMSRKGKSTYRWWHHDTDG